MRIHQMGPRVCYSPEGAAAGGAADAGAAAAAGNPGGGANGGAAPGNGSPDNNGAAPSWADGLTPENRALATAKGWVDPNKGLDSYRELEAKVGSAIHLPGKDAKPEDWLGIYDKLGRPKVPTEYPLARPAGLPADAPYNAQRVEEMKTLFHTAGLTPQQAAAVHDGIVLHADKIRTEKAQAETVAVSKAHEAITKVWGDPESATYKRNNELANRAIRQLGNDTLVSELKEIGVMTGDGLIARAPNLAFLFAKIGEMNFAEDTLYGGVGTVANPFAAATENPDEQGKIIKADPDRARALIRAAGLDPKEYMLA